KGDSWKQSHRAINDSHFEVDYFDLSEAANPSDNIRKIGSKAQASLHLDGGLLKVLHFRLQDGDRLGIIIHHLIVDGVSWRILLEDLATAYEQVTTGTPVKLPLKTDSFQRWAFQLRKQVRNIGKSRTHWIRLAARQLPEFPI
ncbi:MAG: condensation domain-containing protein, partial [Pseudomonadales bacterium]